MSYTINPNAKNKWARNAENTMDLSLETDASSVYLDNGRTLEQEIGEGSMVSNVATVDSSVSKVIDGTLDGAYESCVFKGKSLVNLVRNTGTKLFGTSGLGKINRTETSHGMIYETSREDLNTYITIRTGANPMMKPNTSYTIFFEIVQNTIIKDGQSYKGVTVCGTNDSYYDRATNQLYHNSNFSLDKGIKSILVTTGSDISSYDGFGFGFPSISSGGVEQGQVFEIQNVMVVEGDHVNQDIPYFEGLCDVKMPVLTSTGKNLFNINEYSTKSQHASINGNTITVNAPTTYSNTEYTLTGLKEGELYQVSLDKTGLGEFSIRDKDNSSALVYFESQQGHLSKTFRYQKGSKIRIGNREIVNSELSFENIQIEHGSTETAHESYKTNILRTSEEIVLREVNGVQDTYNLLTREYVKHIEEITLNGSESWASQTDSNWNNDTHISFRFKINDMKVNIWDSGKSNCISDKFKTKLLNSNSYITAEEFIGSDGHTIGEINFNIKLLRSRLNGNETVDGFKQWLSQNPVTVQYELATPITTIVEPSTMTPFAYQNGHVILESGFEGQSLLPTLEYSTVVNKTGQIESVAKTIQRQEKQLTMLEKMLIQNIINLDYNNTLLTLKNEMEEML